MAADDYKPGRVRPGVPVKGAEDLRMQVCSSAVRPERPASSKAAKVWPPDTKGENGHAMWPFSTRPERCPARAPSRPTNSAS